MYTYFKNSWGFSKIFYPVLADIFIELLHKSNKYFLKYNCSVADYNPDSDRDIIQRVGL